MGYKPNNKIYNLSFTDYPGLEIRAKGTSIGKLQWMQEQRVNLNEEDEAKKLAVFTFFANRIVSWNIEHPEVDPEDKNTDGACIHCGQSEDDPMVPSVQSLMCLDLGFVMGIIFGWMAAVARVSVPKGMSLNDGGQNSPEELLMRQLASLQNPTTLPTPNLS